MIVQSNLWTLHPLSSWANTQVGNAITWSPQAWTLGSTGGSGVAFLPKTQCCAYDLSLQVSDVRLAAHVLGASSVLVFYVLFKLSPYLSNASARTYSSLSQKDKIDWDSRYGNGQCDNI